ncbi:unnamed protein product, partial [Pylaiella littoralis]
MEFGGDDSADGAGGAGSGVPDKLCDACTPPATSSYRCVVCNMTHTGGGCGASESFGQRDDFAHSLGDKARICVKCKPALEQQGRASNQKERAADGVVTSR